MPKKIIEQETGAALSIRIDAAIKKAIERAAKADDRSVTSYVQKIIKERLQQDGFLK